MSVVYSHRLLLSVSPSCAAAVTPPVMKSQQELTLGQSMTAVARAQVPGKVYQGLAGRSLAP